MSEYRVTDGMTTHVFDTMAEARRDAVDWADSDEIAENGRRITFDTTRGDHRIITRGPRGGIRIGQAHPGRILS